MAITEVRLLPPCGGAAATDPRLPGGEEPLTVGIEIDGTSAAPGGEGGNGGSGAVDMRRDFSAVAPVTIRSSPTTRLGAAETTDGRWRGGDTALPALPAPPALSTGPAW